MLVRLTGEQVGEFWEGIRLSIERSLPPAVKVPERDRLVGMAVHGDLHVWLSFGQYEGKAKPSLVGTTLFVDDAISDTTNLMIYTMYSFMPRGQELWQEDYKQLAEFAAAQGCYKVVGYTNVPEVLGIVKSLGGKADFMFIELEV